MSIELPFTPEEFLEVVSSHEAAKDAYLISKIGSTALSNIRQQDELAVSAELSLSEEEYELYRKQEDLRELAYVFGLSESTDSPEEEAFFEATEAMEGFIDSRFGHIGQYGLRWTGVAGEHGDKYQLQLATKQHEMYTYDRLQAIIDPNDMESGVQLTHLSFRPMGPKPSSWNDVITLENDVTEEHVQMLGEALKRLAVINSELTEASK